MASKLINNNIRYNQNKYYKIFFQRAILNKFFVVYMLFVATIDDK